MIYRHISSERTRATAEATGSRSVFRCAHRQRCSSANLPGFTIFELLLVLAVIALIAGLSWPQLLGLLQRRDLQSSSELVRRELDLGRIKAVEEGLTYQFRYEPYGRKFVLLPYDLITTPESTSDVATLTQTAQNTTKLAHVYQLSEGCSFYVESSLTADPNERVVAERLGDPWLQFIDTGMLERDVTWSAPILYFADGSATDGLVTIIDEKQNYVTLGVRGLTGSVAISDIERMRGVLGGIR